MSFWVRGNDQPGVYSVSLLFLYKYSNADSNMSHRIVKKSFEIEARSSLSTSCIRSRNFDRSCQLAFSMNNLLHSTGSTSGDYNKKSTLKLCSLVCVSKNWVLRSSNPEVVRLRHQNQDASDYAIDCVTDSCQVTDQEQLHFVVTLERVTNADDYRCFALAHGR